MSGAVLILRPQPGADESAERARRLGLATVVTPLFRVEPLDWQPPDPAEFEAVMLTSANAARHGGPQLALFRHLPAFAVGEATAEAAAEAGFADIRPGPVDADALVAMMADQGFGSAIHPCGEDHIAPGLVGLRLHSVPVYRAIAGDALEGRALAALEDGALALLHSPRAAALFSTLAAPYRARVAIAAISANVAEAAGPGWRSVAIADRPRDQALLELAAKLCQTGGAC